MAYHAGKSKPSPLIIWRSTINKQEYLICQ